MSAIIGLAGTFASGKDTLAGYLVEKYGLAHVSTSEIVREYSRKWHGNDHRPNLVQTANRIRSEQGNGALIDMSVERHEAAKSDAPGVIISGIRSIGEVEELHKLGGTLFFIDADQKIRYERVMSRRRDAHEGTISFEEFAHSEEVESSRHDPSDKSVQNLPAMREMADTVLFNDNDLNEFLASADTAIAELL